jgi:ATP-dependent DNA helicase PIF1
MNRKRQSRRRSVGGQAEKKRRRCSVNGREARKRQRRYDHTGLTPEVLNKVAKSVPRSGGAQRQLLLGATGGDLAVVNPALALDGAADVHDLLKCHVETARHWDFKDFIARASRYRYVETHNDYCAVTPSVMCWGCGTMMFERDYDPFHWVDVDHVDQSPAARAYPAHSASIVSRDSVKGPGAFDVRVCNHCKSLDVRSRKKYGTENGLATCRLFLDLHAGLDDGVGTDAIHTPPVITAVADDYPIINGLSLVSLKWMHHIAKPPERCEKVPGGGKQPYLHFHGSVKKEYNGCVGVMYDSGDMDVDLTDERVASGQAALQYFHLNNPLFAAYDCDFERRRVGDSSVGVDSSVPCLRAGVDCAKAVLAPIAANSQHRKLGSESGYLCPVDDFDSAIRSVDINQLAIGSQTRRVGQATSSDDVDPCGDSVVGASSDVAPEPVLYSDELLEAKVFPLIYYHGRGCYHPSFYKRDRARTMSPHHYRKSRLCAPVPTWRNNFVWQFFMFDWMEKQRIHEAQGVMLCPADATKSGRDVTVADLRYPDHPDSDLKRCFVPASVSGSCAYGRKNFLDLCAMCDARGCPDMFLTITCNDNGWIDIQERCCCDGDRPVTKCPLPVVEQFHRRVRFLMKKIADGRVFGDVSEHFLKWEYQCRGSPHCHLLIWLADDNKEDKCQWVAATIPRSAMSVRSKVASTTAKRAAVFTMLRENVCQYNIHTHSPKCLLVKSAHNIGQALTCLRDRVRAFDDAMDGLSDLTADQVRLLNEERSVIVGQITQLEGGLDQALCDDDSVLKSVLGDIARPATAGQEGVGVTGGEDRGGETNELGPPRTNPSSPSSSPSLCDADSVLTSVFDDVARPATAGHEGVGAVGGEDREGKTNELVPPRTDSSSPSSSPSTGDGDGRDTFKGATQTSLPASIMCKDHYPAVASSVCFLPPSTGDRWHYFRMKPEDDDGDDDTMVIEYNPYVALVWNGHSNCRLTNDNLLIDYLAKYAAKMEPVFDVEVLDDMSPETKAYLRSEEGRHIHGRVIGTCEVAARLMGYPHVQMSSKVHFLPTELPSRRVRTVNMQKVESDLSGRFTSCVVTADADVGGPKVCKREKKSLSAVHKLFVKKTRDGDNALVLDVDVPDDPDDVSNYLFDDKFMIYLSRPADPCFDDVCYPDYYRNYRVCSRSEKAPTSKSKEYWIDGTGRLVVKRVGKKAICRWHCKLPTDDDGLDNEAYYFQQLMLRAAVRRECDLVSDDNQLKGQPGQYKEECFLRRIFAREQSPLDNLRALSKDTKDPGVLRMIKKFQTKIISRQSVVGDLCDVGSVFVDIDAARRKQRLQRESSCVPYCGLTPSQQKVYYHVCRDILDGKQSLVYLGGGAGSGKTCLLNSMVAALGRSGRVVGVCATSGCAASLIGGMTVHRCCGLKRDLSASLTPDVRHRLGSLDVLVIDEISMMSDVLLCAVDRNLRKVRKRPDVPFGGVSVLCVGDLAQLPAVLDKVSDDVGSRVGQYVWEGDEWKWFTKYVLSGNQRQSDATFPGLLNRVRKDELTPDDICTLKACFLPWDAAMNRIRDDGYTAVCARRAVVNDINQVCARRDGGAAVTLLSVDRIPQTGLDVTAVTDSALLAAVDRLAGMPRNLTLRVGDRVMVKMNVDPDSGVVNGMTGTVKRVYKDYKCVVIARDVPGPNGDMSDVFLTAMSEYVTVKPHSMLTKVVQRKQVPLVLCSASTIHAFQGQERDKLVVVIDDMNDQCGQFYTALSRVRSLDGLVLTSKHVKQLTTTRLTRAIRSDTTVLKGMDTWRAALDDMAAPPVDFLGDLGSLLIVAAALASLVSTSRKPSGSHTSSGVGRSSTSGESSSVGGSSPCPSVPLFGDRSSALVGSSGPRRSGRIASRGVVSAPLVPETLIDIVLRGVDRVNGSDFVPLSFLRPNYLSTVQRLRVFELMSSNKWVGESCLGVRDYSYGGGSCGGFCLPVWNVRDYANSCAVDTLYAVLQVWDLFCPFSC